VTQYYVYTIANKSGTLYVGMTNDLKKRVYEHKEKLIPGFTNKYNIDRLIYFKTYSDADSAIAREKQLKKWRREKKLNLIKSQNPDLNDLSADWFD
jgi:putative endonuclease